MCSRDGDVDADRQKIRSKVKQKRENKKILHDLANNNEHVALKRAAEDREGWRHRERM